MTDNTSMDVSADAPAPATRVLLVDDQLIIVEAVRRMLAGQRDIAFHFVTDAASAVQTAEQVMPTVILQDLVMPGIDGFSLIQAYRAHAHLRDVPVIVLSSKEDPKLKAHGFAVGANDYMVKLPDHLELLARLRYHSAALISRQQRDEAFGALRESQRLLAEANVELKKMASVDGMTGIANRRQFDDTMQAEWQRGQREQQELTLLLCDVDCFKTYNDSYGHQAGDAALKAIAAVLASHLRRPADVAARYGGEEFAVILPATEAEGAQQVAESCRAGIEALALAHAGGAGGVVTISIGIASVVPSPDSTLEALIAAADKALYSAKGAGRNRVATAN
jgi:two-component system chemotaxis family response regulator WspR